VLMRAFGACGAGILHLLSIRKGAAVFAPLKAAISENFRTDLRIYSVGLC